MKKIITLTAFGFALIINISACKPNGDNNSTDASNSLGDAIDSTNFSRMDTSNILPLGTNDSVKYDTLKRPGIR
ncbi:MAG: hypothetical protein WKF91_04195 [Segetibacter sp.]|jgi:hypothetical protein